MQNSSGHKPTCPRFEFISSRQVEDMVIALFPGFEAMTDLLLGYARLKTKKSEWEIAAIRVELQWVIIAFRFWLCSHESSMFGPMVHMKRECTFVIKEFGKGRPGMIFIPK